MNEGRLVESLLFSAMDGLHQAMLVGADGTGSKVRKQYLPSARIVDTGIVGAACGLPLSVATRSLMPDHLLTRLTSVLPVKSTYMIVTQSIYKPEAEHIVDAIGDHVIWVFVSSRGMYGDADPKTMDGSSIKSLVLNMMKTWHPVLRQLVADSDSTQVAAVTVLSSTPVPPWEPSNVTLVGDAIHTMTPLQGLGGSTALRDAGSLCRKLIEVDRGSSMLLEAIRDYECAMRDYGFRAVQRSAQFGKLALSDNWLLRTSFKTALRLITQWICCRAGFFLPVWVLSRLFRRLFLESLLKAFDAGKLEFFSSLDSLRNRNTFLAHTAPTREGLGSLC